jgi:DNA invertase Pin-like site-specific DNA recombinase
MRTAPKAKPIAIYLRVSSEEQASSGLGLDDQQTRCAAYVEALGLGSDVRVFVDAGVSGKTLERPAMAEVLALLRRRALAGVVVLKLDRLTRSLRDLLALVAEIERHGAALHSVTERVDTGSAVGRMLLGVLGSVAEWERETIAERTRAAVRAKRRGGGAHGFAPLGARVEDGKLVPVAEEAEAIAIIRDRHAAGASYRGIAAELRARGLPTARGGKWAPGTVHRVISRLERDGFAAGLDVAA